jgi:large subunit ribosomal protein L23
MALLNIFKKKKKPRKAAPRPRGEKPEKIVKKKSVPPPKPKKISEIAYRVLKEPHITEKATDLTKKNQYVFKVFPRANKVEIKRAVEDLYGVNVVSVQIINVPSRKRRLGAIEGERGGYKKAIVKVAEGQKIEVLPH